MSEEKNCQSCKYRGLTKKHATIMVSSFVILFFSMYGFYHFVKNLISKNKQIVSLSENIFGSSNL